MVTLEHAQVPAPDHRHLFKLLDMEGFTLKAHSHSHGLSDSCHARQLPHAPQQFRVQTWGLLRDRQHCRLLFWDWLSLNQKRIETIWWRDEQACCDDANGTWMGMMTVLMAMIRWRWCASIIDRWRLQKKQPQGTLQGDSVVFETVQVLMVYNIFGLYHLCNTQFQYTVSKEKAAK